MIWYIAFYATLVLSVLLIAKMDKRQKDAD